jgi:hypothetical protein
MKQLVVSSLAVLFVLAATTSAQAGIFGRLSTVWNGCNPCVPVECMPCEPIACDPCVPVACDPCNGFVGRPFVPFRPFGGLFANLGARFSMVHCGPVLCDPCEPVACNPCEPVCDPCAVVCGPSFPLPFNGFFLNLRSRLAFGAFHCGPAMCDPCTPVTCDPCAPCSW